MTIEIFRNIKIEVVHKSKSVVVFKKLIFKDDIVTVKWEEVVDFVEYFQAYIKNHLTMNLVYEYSKSLKFELHKSENNVVLLAMHYNEASYAYSKLNAGKIVHKMNRILGRCDLLYQEQ